MRLGRALRGERGITGLETAIILIAFVVVASVFAYTVLSAGIFSSQKGQEAVYSGLDKTQATLEIKGDMTYCEIGDTDQEVDYIAFVVANALTGGKAIDLTGPTDAGDNGIADAGSSNVVVITYVDKYQRVEDLYWEATEYGDGDGDSLLETNEKFLILVGDTGNAGDLEDALTTDLGVSTTFTLEVKPPQGASLIVEKTTPDRLDDYGVLW
jgi:flagellin FlaB